MWPCWPKICQRGERITSQAGNHRCPVPGGLVLGTSGDVFFFVALFVWVFWDFYTFFSSVLKQVLGGKGLSGKLLPV